MQPQPMAYVELSQTLAESFNALADEVQTLADRKTVLEHKLRFAHEQFQYLADKYAPAAPEIADTLSKIQLPPYTSVDNTSPVPLPQRTTQSSQHHLALVIRDGRRAASRLAASLGDASKTTVSSKGTFSHGSNDDVSSMSTALEQDFTVQGKRGALQCPFQKPAEDLNGSQSAPNIGTSHYDPSDPICAALADGTESSHAATGNGASAPSKCPIRFLDKHSPEVVARYVEMHKHELPRSHEVCLRRYGRNEQEVRKLDSKYGNIASMIEDLGQLHQSMLPEDGQHPLAASEADETSNRRVESWANGVNTSSHTDEDDAIPDDDQDRQSHFDRPLKEVRVGESPSRPWGISVPVYGADDRDRNLLSPPAAPLKLPTPHHPPGAEGGPKKCPFDHTKFASFAGGRGGETPKPPLKDGPGSSKDGPALQGPPPFTPFRDDAARLSPTHGPQQQQPVFVAPDALRGKSDPPQMVFTGPVFIGYPMDQALQFMNQFQRRS
ncbi:hypothetical protein CCM_01548 [Cordyceps militaris CM01]|uniref:Uncharacterized protein n=1 Tax=Cordyceps militaris (strain CM01) TaxID=983644 RepID=G3J5N4_CORMM|nr:uncharacterized protein CCM_01548 [Cordyceps militaris CM01]EGX96890.1 hypothetical protein CCM_01548 [Cordyceps militaris CM01]